MIGFTDLYRTTVLAAVTGVSVALLAACTSSGGSTLPSCDATCQSNLSAADAPTGPVDQFGNPIDSGSAPAGGPSTYTLDVTGDASDSTVITYTTAGGSIEQATKAALPWTMDVPAGGLGVVLSAQDDVGGTTITCSITDNVSGVVVDTHTSTGPFAIAECQTG